ncbi:MAG: hypothetical protein ABC595_03855 [Candidatus Methanosuratincola petrocarbonis]
MSSLKTFYEYGKVSKDDLGLDRQDVKILDRLADEKAGVLDHSKGGYRLKQYVGAIPLHSCVLEVLPKIYRGEGGTVQNRLALFWLLSFVGAFEIKESDFLKKGLEKMDFFDLMKYVFARNLNDQVKDGVYRDYVPAEGNERYLKGRLDFVKDIRHNYADRSRFYVRYDEYTEDNPMNRTLAAAVRGMVPGSGVMSRQLLARLSAAFCDVGYENGNGLLVQRVTKNRLNERYWPSYEMAKIFLSGKVPQIYSGKDLLTYGFLFDMNRLFEEFVGKFLKRHANEIFGEGAEALVQPGYRFGDLAIRPDVIIRLKDRTIVLDTKYKGIPEETERSNADIFQVYTYCMAMKERDPSNEAVGILLYPKHVGEDVNQKCETKSVGKVSEYHAKICRRLIDLDVGYGRGNLEKFVERFEELFKGAI